MLILKDGTEMMGRWKEGEYEPLEDISDSDEEKKDNED